MQIESRSVNIMENRQETQNQRLNAWRNINTKLEAFESSMSELQELDNFLVLRATSGDSDILQATAGSGAANGSYSILVDQLATNSKLIHQGWTDSHSTAVNSSGSDQNFSYTLGSGDNAETITVSVATGSSLGDLVALINNDANNPGIQATILNDGSGSDTAYHLVLTSEDSGESSQIVIEDSLTTLGATGSEFHQASIEQSQLGQNARIRVDGYPAESWIESESNLVEDVISGVDLNLLKVSAGEEIQVTVTSDKTAVKQKINEFVSSYNEVIGLLNAYSSYDAENEEMGLLLGDSGVSQLERRLNSIVNRPLTGLPETNSVSSLSQIGIRSSAGGLLAVDSDDLDEALEEQFKDVGNFFTFSSRSTSSHLSYFTRTEDVPPGEVAVHLEYDAAGTLLSATMNGVATNVNGNLISGAEDSDYEGLRLRFENPGGGAGTIDATVTLSYGVAAAFTQTLNSLIDSENGLVQYQTSKLEDGLETLATQIEDMYTRLESVRAQYTREFLAMETAISRLQSQASALNNL